jgi:hypothetical protein
MSASARDLISGLLCSEPSMRLGTNGIHAIKNHPFFAGVDWDNLYKESREHIFIPCPVNMTDTGYFDARDNGEGTNNLTDDSDSNSDDDDSEQCDQHESEHEGSIPIGSGRRRSLVPETEAFVNFSYKSLPSLADLNRLHHDTIATTPSQGKVDAASRGITLLNEGVSSASMSDSNKSTASSRAGASPHDSSNSSNWERERESRDIIGDDDDDDSSSSNADGEH